MLTLQAVNSNKQLGILLMKSASRFDQDKIIEIVSNDTFSFECVYIHHSIGWSIWIASIKKTSNRMHVGCNLSIGIIMKINYCVSIY